MTPERGTRLLPGVRRGDHLIAGLDLQLDALDIEIIGERRLLFRELRPKLAALGFDVSGFTEPPFPHPLEQRPSQHADLNPYQARAQARAAKRGLIVRNSGQVLDVR